jgi:hypothetical protein
MVEVVKGAPAVRRYSIDLPGVCVKSEANTRGHWRASAARKKHQRQTAAAMVSFVRPALRAHDVVYGVVVTMIRVYSGRERPFDSDNLAGAFKAVRDGIADAFGIDDGLPFYDWQVRQEKGAISGTRVEIVGRQ